MPVTLVVDLTSATTLAGATGWCCWLVHKAMDIKLECQDILFFHLLNPHTTVSTLPEGASFLLRNTHSGGESEKIAQGNLKGGIELMNMVQGFRQFSTNTLIIEFTSSPISESSVWGGIILGLSWTTKDTNSMRTPNEGYTLLHSFRLDLVENLITTS